MNGKLDEKLIRLAFDESDATEVEGLERKVQSDPELGRRVSEYRSLKSNLELLKDVPEDQFSKERLRNAILTQGLKPVPASEGSRWGWTWMPVTAFAAAFGWMFLTRTNAPIAKIAIPKHEVVAFDDRQPLRISTTANDVQKPKPVQTMVLTAKKHSAHRHRTPEAHAPHDSFLAFNASRAADAANRVVALLSAAQTIHEEPVTESSVDSSSRAPQLTSVETPMVLIDPDRDGDSGAQRATEVDSASNVVVRG